MILDFPGYELTEIVGEGVNTILYRGKAENSQLTILLKVLKAEFPTLAQIARLKNEYHITENLHLAGVVKIYHLKKYNNHPALIYEDFGGVSLKSLLVETLSIIDFLTIAVQVNQSLISLHEHEIIHKDIKPANIIINPTTKIVKLTGLGIASRLNKETLQLTNPNQIEGTLAYISPEQTGRMNRSIDYRCDFYSLGVSFYEMLTGQLPFQTTDPLELIHCHIAKQPTPIEQLNLDVPPVVAQIVAKLMAKNASDRYQSARGLQADLKFCLDQLTTTGTIPSFIPGLRDRKGQLLIPQKLYGREEQVSQLLAAFARVASTGGKREVVLVSGYSGIGKSSLVNEVHKPITARHSYFISGKFDQFKRDIPYLALTQAFQSLIRELLTSDVEKLENWRKKILKALGINGQAIIDIIPDLEIIIGAQPALEALGALESRNRLNQIFQDLICVFAQPEHPLVIFLDDLQWADSASLKFLELLMSNPNVSSLLLIGAYRDNEVSATHPIIQMLSEIQTAKTTVTNITVSPLNLDCVQQFIDDALNVSGKNNCELTGLLFNKTSGNPFFLTQILKTLYQEKLLTFDFDAGRWLWNLEEIKSFGIADLGIVELLVGNLSKLPPATQEILKLGACVGARFSLDILAIASQQSLSEVATHLWVALSQGFILPSGSAYKVPLVMETEELQELAFDSTNLEYRFLHDRVQQAAYALIPSCERSPIHLQIGQVLLKHIAPQQQTERIFEIVNQFNMAIELLHRQEDKTQLAQLNLSAGKKALVTAAYEPALKYLSIGIELLGQPCWLQEYDLALALHEAANEAAYLTCNFSQVEELSSIVLQNAKTLLEKVKTYEVQIFALVAQKELTKAVKIGVEVLNMLGKKLTLNPSRLDILLSFLQTKIAIAVKGIEKLAHLPTMTDPKELAARRITTAIGSATYLTEPNLAVLMILQDLRDTLCKGYNPQFTASAAAYGLLLCGIFNDIENGYKFGKLTVQLAERSNNKLVSARGLYVTAISIQPWKMHLQESLPILQLTAEYAQASGDLESVSWMIVLSHRYEFWMGRELTYLERKMPTCDSHIRPIKQELPLLDQNLIWQVMLNLQGKVSDPCCLDGEVFQESQILPQYQANNFIAGLAIIYINKLFLNYVFGHYTQALDCAESFAKYQPGIIALIENALFYFYDSLVRLALFPSLSVRSQKRMLKRVDRNQRKMRNWSHHAPMNFQHKYDLVLAERCRVLKRHHQAMEYYDRAIAGAVRGRYTQEEAIAYERAGEFYLAWGKTIAAQAYLTKAYDAYKRWGATAKVKQLVSNYSSFLQQISQEQSTQVVNTTNANLALDLETVIKASQALSGEIVLNRLLDKLLNLVKENAGAQTVVFLIKNENQFEIKAEITQENSQVHFLEAASAPGDLLPLSLINYASRTCSYLVLDNAVESPQFSTDPYIVSQRPLSVLVLPIIYQSKLSGMLYLENNLATYVFTRDRINILNILATQAAISIENAGFYETLEKRVESRTKSLQAALESLQQAQAQLVQCEKMSSLGQLVGGIAHEVNNPISFINGNLHYANDYFQSVFELLDLYQKTYPDPTEEIVDKIEEIDLDYIRFDIPKMLASMRYGVQRVRDIVNSLRTFARLDESTQKTVNLHECLEITLLMLNNRLHKIQVSKQYGNLPDINCYPRDLNQVFVNLLNNAVDALKEIKAPAIGIKTEVRENNQIAICISDNGVGMTEEVLAKIFDPFFTTKPVGQGTGLGLSISYQIVVEQHCGRLTASSTPGVGTEFTILLPC